MNNQKDIDKKGDAVRIPCNELLGNLEPRRVVSFSCGASSAVMAKMATQMYDNTIVVYCDPGGEHESNKRFLKDIEKWIGKQITTLKNPKYVDHFDVFRKVKYIAGIQGAACAKRLKIDMKKQYSEPDDIHLFGYTVEEVKRAERFDERHSELTEWLLINEGITKADCLGLLWRAGIELPKMYDLGYDHNNCIGCVKGGAGYWNKIRIDFPDHFEIMARIERELNYPILKKDKYLDKLKPGEGRFADEQPIQCGIQCENLFVQVT